MYTKLRVKLYCCNVKISFGKAQNECCIFFKFLHVNARVPSLSPLPEVDFNASCLTLYEVNIKVAVATSISPQGKHCRV